MGALKFSPELLDYKTWPDVDPGQLSKEICERFTLFQSAIKEICNGIKISAVARKYEVSRSDLYYLLNRAINVHADGRPWGFRALIKHCRQKEYTRSASTAGTERNDGSGLAGAFALMLLEHPKVVSIINKSIPLNSNTLKEAGLNIKSLHHSILMQLRQEKVSTDEYPFNTRDNGYISLVSHINLLILNGNLGAAKARFGKDWASGLMAGTGKKGLFRSDTPYEFVCYDEQQMPFIGTIVIEIDGKENDIPISRGYICPMVDTRSLAILGYSVTISERFSSADILAAYESTIRPWTPKILTFERIQYLAGGGLPSGVVPEAKGMRIGVINVDNHLSHLANAVVGHLRSRTGSIIRFGQVRRWIARTAVESLFAQMQKRGFIRLPSTTASGPDHPNVNDPVGKAVKFRIRMHELLQVIDVLIANYNAESRLQLMSKTPNECIANELANGRDITVIPKFSQEILEDPQIAVEIITATIAGSLQKARRPYVQIDGAHYTNDILSQSWNLIGQKVTCHIKVRGDFRSVRMFLANGQEFGTLGVCGFWAYHFHTREMRKEIIRLQKLNIIPQRSNDPIGDYTRHLVTESLVQNSKKHKRISREASQLAKAMHAEGIEDLKHVVVEVPEETLENRKSRGRRQFFSG